MTAITVQRKRIVVIARPALGRRVADELYAAGYEVYRTPSAFGITRLNDRIRPDLAIIAIDLPGHDAIAAALELRLESGGLPVLLLGDATADRRAVDFPVLSSVEHSHLADTIARMLGTPDHSIKTDRQ